MLGPAMAGTKTMSLVVRLTSTKKQEEKKKNISLKKNKGSPVGVNSIWIRRNRHFIVNNPIGKWVSNCGTASKSNRLKSG